MFKLYNSNLNISSNLSTFFKRVFPTISKPHLKLIPNILIGLINAESVVTTDIVKKLKDDFSLVLLLIFLLLMKVSLSSLPYSNIKNVI